MKKIILTLFCLCTLSAWAQKDIAVGSVAPDFTLNDPDGKAVKLSDFKGKYLLLDFWASWCGPCRKENPNVVKAYEKFKNKNFDVLGVSLDRPNGKVDWITAIKKDNLTWTQVWDSEFKVAKELYKVQYIPQNFLIDPKGKVIAIGLKGEDLEKKLGEILK